ncbi:uncharacterized protein LOC120412628 isoform X2 [Culex pipiens pallens]|uniref:uncharacterized protein LOC120412628 isoform X2 n=1 Tax=Culex pipiens pallens TaxID=42434 RepID=UPI001954A3CE|nr:uncharacterized protein LOC120412628 isoform X2 [Culex pipiens pallens]
MAQVPARNPKYSAADLWPPGSKDRDFPPAAFFPVYVGNFLCQQRAELVARVQQYFASKGLLARMVFVRSAQNDPFQSYQDKTKLYDCLVYLTRQRDAQDAVKYLHRDKYYGHRLNVFPGRNRHYFSPDSTVQVVGQVPGVCDDSPAQMFEDEVRKATCKAISCNARNALDQVLLEFKSSEEMETGIRLAYRKGIGLTSIKTPALKQRFIEADIKQEIRKRQQFVQELPSPDVLRKLMQRKKKRQARLPANHDHVIQALRRIQTVAAQRHLSIDLYRAMFPNAYNQFMAVLQASNGDSQAIGFIQTYVAPWQLRQNQLNPWEWMHVHLHNEGLNYVQGVITKRLLN